MLLPYVLLRTESEIRYIHSTCIMHIVRRVRHKCWVLCTSLNVLYILLLPHIALCGIWQTCSFLSYQEMKVTQKNHKKGLKYYQIICTISAIKRLEEWILRSDCLIKISACKKKNGTQIVSHKGWLPLIVSKKSMQPCSFDYLPLSSKRKSPKKCKNSPSDSISLLWPQEKKYDRPLF